jgi:hypothetical protein
MAVIMAATYPELFAAIGVHSGLAYKSATSLTEARPAMTAAGADPSRLGQLAFEAPGNLGDSKHLMRVIVFQGTKDGAVSPANADRIISQWAKTNDLIDDGKSNNSVDDAADSKQKGTVASGYSFKVEVYNDHAGKPLMEKWIVEEMKNAWSGGAAGVPTQIQRDPMPVCRCAGFSSSPLLSQGTRSRPSTDYADYRSGGQEQQAGAGTRRYFAPACSCSCLLPLLPGSLCLCNLMRNLWIAFFQLCHSGCQRELLFFSRSR